ncbi:leucine-rich repeat-containing protein [Tritrichomonas foetus]|uniref:Leucine-rich repeat-containing protein n=1 Tax=Tritrichomonas foetus TaxID=1144522 RepID=A0A1J4K1X2_9EUKA|nr:leucine-rich repeat-containing protein [Tritrichomonas foetus]|eukprot:OHT05441.1 leucine-rich repeat-containing protein [Tritrichomonas foetus]
MGGNNSRHDQSIPRNQAELNLSNQKIRSIPVHIPHKNKLVILDLSNNSINSLPPKFPRLTKLILQRNNLEEIPVQFEKPLLGMKKLEHLDLSINKLSKIPDYFTEFQSIKRIDLYTNYLSDFPNFPPGIELLDLSQNKFTKIPRLPATVIALVMNYNKIEDIDTFIQNARVLSMSMNRIQNIKPNLIFNYLATLDLSMNKLENIPNFKLTTPKLFKIDLSYNLLKTFPCFPDSIKEVNLNRNFITEIPDIRHLVNFEILKISENQLEKVNSLPPTLINVFMNDNKISSFEESNLEKLQIIHLFNNKLEQVPKLGNTLVKDVFLMGNLLKSFDLPNSMFIKELLTKINISDNNIDQLSPEIFDLPNLIYLNISNNKVKKVPRIISLSKILFLNVSHNPLGKIKFDLPVTIMTFYCANCELTDLPDSLSDCPNLSILICSENQIEKVPFIPNLGSLNASNNSINMFPKLNQNIQQIDLSLNQIEKVPEVVNFPHLAELDLSHNKLINIFDLNESNFDSLKVFKFSHNQELKGEIELVFLPLLETIDISFTGIDLKDEPSVTVREVITSNPEKVCNFQYKLMTEPDFVGYSEMCGLRETMEDAIVARPFICNGCDVYAVLDGHGGILTSNYGVFKIAQLFDSSMDSNNEEKPNQEMESLQNQLNSYFDSSSSSKSKSKSESSSSSSSKGSEDDSSEAEIEKKKTKKNKKEKNQNEKNSMDKEECDKYSWVNEKFVRRKVKDLVEDLKQQNFIDGATMALALLSNNKLIAANLGDARVLLVKDDGTVKMATVDHKPMDRSEIDRILDLGGRVTNERVDGVLAISRSLGDFTIFGISYEPDIVAVNIEKDDKWLILACDGVFDVLTNEEVGRIAAASSNAAELAYKIRNTSFVKLSADNISAMAIDLKKRNEKAEKL